MLSATTDRIPKLTLNLSIRYSNIDVGGERPHQARAQKLYTAQRVFVKVNRTYARKTLPFDNSNSTLPGTY